MGSRILSVRMGEPRPWLVPDTRCWLYGHPWPGMVRLLVMTWTVSLIPGAASLAPVMVHLAPPGTASL